MADFMTVLAATQKPTGTGAQGNALAALLSGGQFDNVLSTRIAAAAEAQVQALPLPQALPQASPLPLPQALSDGITLQAKPAATKKSALPTGAETDLAAALTLVPLTLPREAIAGNTADPAGSTAKLDVPALRPTLELAATPAASAATTGQELPLGDRQSLLAVADTAAAATILAKTGSDTPSPRQPVNDQPDTNAVRQIGQFEQVARTPEVRIQAAVEAPVRSSAFSAELSEKIVWLAGNGSHSASLSLNPPQLGPLEVRLSLTGSDAGAQFYSPHPVVRDAIEAAMPRLRELMAQAGIALGDAQVHQEAFSRGDSGGGSGRPSGDSATGTVLASTLPIGAQSVRSGIGLVDLYV